MANKPLDKTPSNRSWLPTQWAPADATAVKAWAAGTADEYQQRRAFNFVMLVSGYHDMSFSPLSERETCFAEGKRSVGSQIKKLVEVPISTITKEPTENG